MANLIIILVILSPACGIAWWAVARHKLLKHLGKNHPKIWLKLQAHIPAGEVVGYPAELAKWVAARGYRDLDDSLLTKYALSYQKSKFVALALTIVGGMLLVVLANGDS